MGGETTNLLDALITASASPWKANHFRKGRTNHISGIAEARVVKSCAQVSYIKSQHTKDKSPVKGLGQGHVTHFKFWGPNDMSRTAKVYCYSLLWLIVAMFVSFLYLIKTCEAGLVLSVTRILRPIPCVCMYVCIYVCMCKNSSQTTEPICIKIIPANRAFYADCYRLLRFEIFTKYDDYCPKERAAVAQPYFANGNVLRDVIVVISVTIWVFRNNPD